MDNSPRDVEKDGEGEGGQHVEGDQAVLTRLQQPALVRLREAHRLQKLNYTTAA